MTKEEWIEALLDENTKLQEQLNECEEENSDLTDALSEIWPDYMATYPATSEELMERYPILKAFS